MSEESTGGQIEGVVCGGKFHKIMEGAQPYSVDGNCMHNRRLSRGCEISIKFEDDNGINVDLYGLLDLNKKDHEDMLVKILEAIATEEL